MAKQGEIQQLADDLHVEVTKDAPHIARMVFGDVAGMPDMAQVSNQHLDDVYRQKFQAEDRTWLQSEARRDPEQFLKVAERIGAKIPPPQPPPPPMTAPPPMAMPSGLPAPLPAAAAPPPVPSALPAPTLPVSLPPAPMVPLASGPMPGASPAPAPVILGPNGQPLPATGMI